MYRYKLLLLLLCTLTTMVYSRKCPGRCICTDHISNCTGNDLDVIPALPVTTSIIVNLAQNHIKALSNNAFLRHNIVYAEEISLDHNKLRLIDVDAFTGMQHLRILDLSNNELRTLDPQMFRHTINLNHLKIHNNRVLNLHDSTPPPPNNNLPQVTSLRHLELSGCMLDSVPTDWLNRFPKLLTLKLDQNNFKNLSNDTFAVNKYIRHLDLRNNAFETLNLDDFKPLTKLTTIDIRFNPIDCKDCSVKDFVATFEDIETKVYGHCYLPVEQKGVALQEVTKCVEKTTTTSTVTPTTTQELPTTEEEFDRLCSVDITPFDFPENKMGQLQVGRQISPEDDLLTAFYFNVFSFVIGLVVGFLFLLLMILAVMKSRRLCSPKHVVIV